jgi:glycosyltransferase involved in cell wall biosynthesis
VIHACEHARDVLPVVEGQLAAGMRPYVVTPGGGGAAEVYLTSKDQEEPNTLSLLRCWQDVRNWRKSILACDPEFSADLVHAHSFTAGMAAVRSCACVVYDLHDCVEDFAVVTGQCEPGSWMGRSFRAAEQFILARAAAVVVHSLGMKKAAEELGAPPENIFLIPDPLPHEEAPIDAIPAEALDPAPRTVNFLVPQLAGAAGECDAQAARVALEAFAQAIREVPGCRLVVVSHPSVEREVARLGISGRVFFLDGGATAAAWQVAHIVLAFGPADALAARHPNPICLKAMRHGIALLAADVLPNRDASPEGRGCLWFDPNNPRDLGSRMAFLAANAGFRKAIGNGGRLHLLETRNVAVIGRKYVEAYRHAASRRKPAGKGPGVAILRPAASCG